MLVGILKRLCISIVSYTILWLIIVIFFLLAFYGRVGLTFFERFIEHESSLGQLIHSFSPSPITKPNSLNSLTNQLVRDFQGPQDVSLSSISAPASMDVELLEGSKLGEEDDTNLTQVAETFFLINEEGEYTPYFKESSPNISLERDK